MIHTQMMVKLRKSFFFNHFGHTRNNIWGVHLKPGGFFSWKYRPPGLYPKCHTLEAALFRTWLIQREICLIPKLWLLSNLRTGRHDISFSCFFPDFHRSWRNPTHQLRTPPETKEIFTMEATQNKVHCEPQRCVAMLGQSTRECMDLTNRNGDFPDESMRFRWPRAGHLMEFR